MVSVLVLVLVLVLVSIWVSVLILVVSVSVSVSAGHPITVVLVSSADSFPPCLDFKLGRNYVVFLGGKIPASTSLQLRVKT